MLRVIAMDHQEPCSIIPDGVYGQQTRAEISSFQRRHDLKANGITDQQTWDAIVAEYEAAKLDLAPACHLVISMKPGCKYCEGDCHTNIRIAQSILGSIASAFGNMQAPAVTGVMDSATMEALRSFQELCSLSSDGRMDKKTWKHLAFIFPLAEARITEK